MGYLVSIDESFYVSLLLYLHLTSSPVLADHSAVADPSDKHGTDRVRETHIPSESGHPVDFSSDASAVLPCDEDAQRQPREMGDLFHLVADSAPVLIWISGADMLCSWFNRPWLEFRGRTMDEECGNGWEEGIHPQDLAHFHDIYQNHFHQRLPFEMEYRLLRYDGVYRWVVDHGVPYFAANGEFQGYIGSCIDITEMKLTERALRESEKLAIVGRLAASIAHEINNPLEAVTNLLYLAVQAADPITRGFLVTAQEELSRISLIAKQTLQFRRQKAVPEPTDMAEMLRSVLALYQGRLAQANIQILIEEENVLPLVCYPGEIRQVLANLIGNAMDAMPRGGTLRIRIHHSVDWRTGNPGLRLTLADNGHGMPPDVRRHIYDPFFTTKETTGTGLGLWISAEIIEKHKGSIHVTSRDHPGSSGTAFTVIFPYNGISSSAA